MYGKIISRAKQSAIRISPFQSVNSQKNQQSTELIEAMKNVVYLPIN